MPCYYPLRAERSTSGVRILGGRRQGEKAGTLDLPCGQCIGCRLERSRQWAARMLFEAQLHDHSAFLTLTYDQEHLPSPPSLDYKHVQLFLKRLRKHVGSFRFFACGEYGDLSYRPHYHLCVFGVDFASLGRDSRGRPFDDRFYLRGSGEEVLYASPQLEKLWGRGQCSVGSLTFESAAYVARYCLKKHTGKQAAEHYRCIDPATGEVHQLQPEFAHMSLKPAIAAEWFKLYKDDVYKGHDYIVVRGVKCRPPRYFDKLLKRVDLQRFEQIKQSRLDDAEFVRLARLEAGETITQARQRLFSSREL